jgi:very-short-patch-repair endonuclease
LFDFFIEKYNLCIEFDGEQHFKAIKYFGGVKNLKLQQKRDSIKNIYCKNNNINLLRIRFDENIEEKITNYFSEKNIQI